MVRVDTECGGKSRPARGAWIETLFSATNFAVVASRPARGAWIETHLLALAQQCRLVAPRTGRVD